jgi:hypothetical protein
MFGQKKKILNSLEDSFGKLKDDNFDFESIRKYYQKKNRTGNYHTISDRTCNDLDFEEFFMFADRTTSKVGQQYLYNTFRSIIYTPERFADQENIIKILQSNPKLRLETQYHLSKLKSNKAYYITSLFNEEHIKQPRWFFIVRLLSFTSIMSILMSIINPVFLFVLLPVFVVNMGFHYWNKRNLYEYIGPIPQLLRLNQVAKELLKLNIYNNISGSLHESIKIIDKVRNRMAFFNLESKIQGDAETAFWFILEIFKTAFLIEPLLLFGVLKELENKKKEIEHVFSFVGYVDCLISIISLRKSLENNCIPGITKSGKSIQFDALYHPLVPGCVENSLATDSKSVLITGSNMSGKTTFIRAVGINLISALTINTCFAKSFQSPLFKLYTAIRISDDLMNDKSYYFQEVLTIKEMIDKSLSNEYDLFLLDEIFKGTNTVERISAGKAVLSTLNNGNNLVFVSTHDIELTEMLDKEYDLYHFSEVVENKSVDFDYKLKPGKLKNRNAIMILKINDYPEALINEALEISGQLDNLTLKKTNNL